MVRITEGFVLCAEYMGNRSSQGMSTYEMGLLKDLWECYCKAALLEKKMKAALHKTYIWSIHVIPKDVKHKCSVK